MCHSLMEGLDWRELQAHLPTDAEVLRPSFLTSPQRYSCNTALQNMLPYTWKGIICFFGLMEVISERDH